MTHNNLQG